MCSRSEKTHALWQDRAWPVETSARRQPGRRGESEGKKGGAGGQPDLPLKRTLWFQSGEQRAGAQRGCWEMMWETGDASLG